MIALSLKLWLKLTDFWLAYSHACMGVAFANMSALRSRGKQVVGFDTTSFALIRQCSASYAIFGPFNSSHLSILCFGRRETQRTRAESLDGQECDVEINLQNSGGAGGVFKNAALEVLRKEERLMTSGEWKGRM